MTKVIFVLLYVITAFDFVEHIVLLQVLEMCVGLFGTVQKWFKSCLDDIRHFVQDNRL